MGKIPRTLSTVAGFVRSDYGLIPYEEGEDKNQIMALARVINKACREGRIVFKNFSPEPLLQDPSPQEKSAMGLIRSHVQKNLLWLSANRNLYDLASRLIKTKKYLFFGTRHWISLEEVKKKLR